MCNTLVFTFSAVIFAAILVKYWCRSHRGNSLDVKGEESITKMSLPNNKAAGEYNPSIHHFSTMSNGIVWLFKLSDKQTIHQLLSKVV